MLAQWRAREKLFDPCHLWVSNVVHITPVESRSISWLTQQYNSLGRFVLFSMAFLDLKHILMNFSLVEHTFWISLNILLITYISDDNWHSCVSKHNGIVSHLHAFPSINILHRIQHISFSVTYALIHVTTIKHFFLRLFFFHFWYFCLLNHLRHNSSISLFLS